MTDSSPGHDCVIQLLRTATVLWRESRRFFRPFRLTDAQFNVLNVLAKARQPASQRELSEKLVVDRSNVTLLLDRMAKAGWVVRRDDPRDRRVYRIGLTAEGRRLWQKIEPHYLKAIRDIAANIRPAEARCALAVMETLERDATRWRKQ